jgi:hypothetical protein
LQNNGDRRSRNFHNGATVTRLTTSSH